MGRPRSLPSIVVIAVFMAIAVGLAVQRNRAYAEGVVDDRFLYIRSVGIMEKMALSYDALLADVYWMRALQHFGGDRLHPETRDRYNLLFPLLDLTTSLDPNFTVAYRFGALFLAEPDPGGAGRPELAIALLEKGVAANPAKWDYYHDIGFVYYWHLHDYKRAAEWFQRGSDIPGSPWWLRTYAAMMLNRGGDRAASRFLWEEIGRNAADDWLKNTARLRVLQIDALTQIDLLDRIVADDERRRGSVPASWEAIVRAGLIGGVPVDPTGVPYTLDAATGAIGVSADSTLYPLPQDPAASR